MFSGEHLEHILEVDVGETVLTYQVDDVGEHLPDEDVFGCKETHLEELEHFAVVALQVDFLAALRIIQYE